MCDYDSVFNELSEAISKYELEKTVFFKREIDHTTLTYFNKQTDGKRGQNREESVTKVLNFLIDNGMLSKVSYKKSRDGGGKLVVLVNYNVPGLTIKDFNFKC